MTKTYTIKAAPGSTIEKFWSIKGLQDTFVKMANAKEMVEQGALAIFLSMPKDIFANMPLVGSRHEVKDKDGKIVSTNKLYDIRIVTDTDKNGKPVQHEESWYKGLVDASPEGQRIQADIMACEREAKAHRDKEEAIPLALTKKKKGYESRRTYLVNLAKKVASIGHVKAEIEKLDGFEVSWLSDASGTRVKTKTPVLIEYTKKVNDKRLQPWNISVEKMLKLQPAKLADMEGSNPLEQLKKTAPGKGADDTQKTDGIKDQTQATVAALNLANYLEKEDSIKFLTTKANEETTRAMSALVDAIGEYLKNGGREKINALPAVEAEAEVESEEATG